MSQCSSCSTKFKFSDVLKGVNPSSIKCGGCDERVKSSYLALFIGVVLFSGFSFIILSLPFFSTSKLVSFFILAFIFELAYFVLLKNGIIKSNLKLS